MRLFPPTANLDPLMEALVRAFDAPSHQPLSRSEEQRRDAFGALCDELAREDAEQLGPTFEKWLLKNLSNNNAQWFLRAAWTGDEDQMRLARDTVICEFIHDCSCDFTEQARIRREELAEQEAEQIAAENEVWK